MRITKDFKGKQILLSRILFSTTSDQNYEMSRTIILEEYDKGEQFVVIKGRHCSCYDFDETEWEAIRYTEEEIKKLAKGWIEHGDSYEVQLGVVFINYLEG